MKLLRASSLILASSLLFACGVQPPGETAENEADKSKPADAKAAPAKSNELTQAELDLLASDPKTLTPEQNRKRGHALRKKIMQNPDSPQAQALEEARQAALAGQVETDPNAKAKPEGLVIPAPDHLRSDEQAVSHDEPAD